MDLMKRMEMLHGIGNGNKVGGRKKEVLDILKKEVDGISIKEISKRIGISNKNVSSQLSYLRDDGYVFGDLGEGKRVLIGKKNKKENKEYVWDGKAFIDVDKVMAEAKETKTRAKSK